MPQIVVILPSQTYRAADFVSAAEKIDADLIVASEHPPPFDMGDRYLHIDCGDQEAAVESILELGDRVGIDAIVAADDAGVTIAAEASTRLGITANPPEAAMATRNKLLLRTALRTAEIIQPSFAALGPGDDLDTVADDVGFPLVVKPLDRSASQGVIRANTSGELRRAVQTVRSIIGEPEATLLIESYVSGTEIAIEGILDGGELRSLATFDKPDTPEGPAFPETIFVTPSRLSSEALSEAHTAAQRAVTALGLRQGPVHIELRVDGTSAYIIEVAARSIGGLCSRSLDFGLSGTTLESLILRNAVGADLSHLRRTPSASGVLMVPPPSTGIFSHVTGENEVRALPHITGMDWTVVAGDRIEPAPFTARYLGFVYARSETPEEVEHALRQAQSKLQVHIEG